MLSPTASNAPGRTEMSPHARDVTRRKRVSPDARDPGSDAARGQHAVDRAQLLQDLGLDLALDVDQRHRQLAA